MVHLYIDGSTDAQRRPMLLVIASKNLTQKRVICQQEQVWATRYYMWQWWLNLNLKAELMHYTTCDNFCSTVGLGKVDIQG